MREALKLAGAGIIAIGIITFAICIVIAVTL